MHLRVPRRRRALAMGVATAVASMAAIFTTGGTAMASYTNCVYDNSSDTVLICGAMNGGGLHVTSALANAGVTWSDTQDYILQACLHGPAGSLACTPFETIAPSGEIEADWDPNANEPAGQYCANIWTESSYSGPDWLLKQVCWTVYA